LKTLGEGRGEGKRSKKRSRKIRLVPEGGKGRRREPR